MMWLDRLKKNRLIGQTITYAMSDGLSRAIPFAIMPILAMYLSPDEFGIASNFIIFVSLVSAIIGLNTESYYAVEYYNVNEAKKVKLAFNLILTNTLAFFMCLILPIFLGRQFEIYFFIPIFWQFLAVLMGLFQLIIELLSTYLRLEEKTKLYLRFKLLASSLSAALSLLFVVVFKWSWEGRVLALLSVSVIISILSIYIFSKNGMFKLIWDPKEIKNIVKYGFPLIPHKLSTWVQGGVESALITKNQGIYNTGLYSFAQNMATVMNLFSQSFTSAFSPYVYKQLSIDQKTVESAIQMKMALIKKTYLALIAFGILLFTSYFVLIFFIKLLFNDEYVKEKLNQKEITAVNFMLYMGALLLSLPVITLFLLLFIKLS